MARNIARIDNVQKLLNEKDVLFQELKKNPPQWWNYVKSDKELYIEIRKYNIVEVYYQGGLVAKIEWDKRNKCITAKCHPKYIGGEDQTNPMCYKQTKNHEAIYQPCEEWLNEEIIYKLKENVKKHYSAKGKDSKTEESEKSIQGKIIVNNRQTYLDSEFAFRQYEGLKNTIRIDLVKVNGGRVIFQELKRKCDSRLWTEKSEGPEIIKQLQDYREFISCNSEELAAYYKSLYKIKKYLGLPVPKVDDIDKLRVAENPELIISEYSYNSKHTKRIERYDKIKNSLKEIGVEYSSTDNKLSLDFYTYES